VPHGREAHLEARGELLEAQPVAGGEAQLADVLPDGAIDAVLDGRDLKRNADLRS
jgi:hypothetical protein